MWRSEGFTTVCPFCSEEVSGLKHLQHVTRLSEEERLAMDAKRVELGFLMLYEGRRAAEAAATEAAGGGRTGSVHIR